MRVPVCEREYTWTWVKEEGRKKTTSVSRRIEKEESNDQNGHERQNEKLKLVIINLLCNNFSRVYWKDISVNLQIPKITLIEFRKMNQAQL